MNHTARGQLACPRAEATKNSHLQERLPQPISFYSRPACSFLSPICLAPFSGPASSKPEAEGRGAPWKLREKRQQWRQCRRPAAGVGFSLCGGDAAETEHCDFSRGQIKPAACRQPEIGFLKCWEFRNANPNGKYSSASPLGFHSETEIPNIPLQWGCSWCGPGTTWTQTICRACVKSSC